MRQIEKISIIQYLTIYLFVVVFTVGFNIFRVFLPESRTSQDVSTYNCKVNMDEKGSYKIFPTLRRILIADVKSIQKEKLVNPVLSEIPELNYLNKYGLSDIYVGISGFKYFHYQATVNTIRSESILTKYGAFLI